MRANAAGGPLRKTRPPRSRGRFRRQFGACPPRGADGGDYVPSTQGRQEFKRSPVGGTARSVRTVPWANRRVPWRRRPACWSLASLSLRSGPFAGGGAPAAPSARRLRTAPLSGAGRPLGTAQGYGRRFPPPGRCQGASPCLQRSTGLTFLGGGDSLVRPFVNLLGNVAGTRAATDLPDRSSRSRQGGWLVRECRPGDLGRASVVPPRPLLPGGGVSLQPWGRVGTCDRERDRRRARGNERSNEHDGTGDPPSPCVCPKQAIRTFPSRWLHLGVTG